ncbi:hypothetical protein L195_g043535, partial [Trifolium pratense]
GFDFDSSTFTSLLPERSISTICCQSDMA